MQQVEILQTEVALGTDKPVNIFLLLFSKITLYFIIFGYIEFRFSCKL